MRRGWVIAVVAVAGGAFAVVAEFVSAAGVAGTVADLATGLTLLACGLWGCYERPTEWRWPLLARAPLLLLRARIRISVLAASISSCRSPSASPARVRPRARKVMDDAAVYSPRPFC